MSPPLVILGGSHAGVAAAAELRAAGFEGAITLISDEDALPYHRPHLSKECLADDMPEPAALRPRAFYADRRIERRHARVDRIERPACLLRLADGEPVAYSRLILAAGARARALPATLPGARQASALRDLRDRRQLADRLSAARHLVVIGGGMIGLEVAAAARARGLQVAVVELAPRLMARSLYPDLAGVVLAHHRANGIVFHLSQSVAAIERDAVHLASGEVLRADLVLASIGSEPRDALARDAGLACDDGIVTDTGGETADPVIWALGDCARWPEAGQARGIRHESVAATQWQAKCVAARIMGRALPDAQPLRLWSTQGACRLQMAGPVDPTARLDLTEQEGGFLLRAFAGKRLLAVQALNAPRAFNAAVARIGVSETEPAGTAPAH